MGRVAISTAPSATFTAIRWYSISIRPIIPTVPTKQATTVPSHHAKMTCRWRSWPGKRTTGRRSIKLWRDVNRTFFFNLVRVGVFSSVYFIDDRQTATRPVLEKRMFRRRAYMTIDLEGLYPFDGDGHWHLCLDYRENWHEPRVTWISTESDSEKRIAGTFAEYL